MTKSDFKVIGDNECIVVTSANCKSKSKIAAYDLDNTLIKTKTLGPFPKDIYDWQLNFKEVPEKLKILHGCGFKIVVFTNQAFIQFGTFTAEEIREKFDAIQKKINIPMQFFAAGVFNVFRKPRIAMWSLLQNSFNDNIPIDISSSFFVGDAAGRIDEINKRRLDHSCADRLFAMNLRLKFFTPEQHFLNSTVEEKFLLPGFDPKMNFDSLNLLEPKDAKLKLDEQEIVIMVGFPASGKSFFVDKYLKDFEVVKSSSSSDLLKIKSILINNKSCVVDDQNPDIKTRANLIELGKKFKVKVRCFHMNTSFWHSRHNMEFRELIANTWNQGSNSELQKYESCFSEPKLEEGFDEIVKINCIPTFESDDCDEKKLYECYLVEK
ncbi:hypothetical protein PVAND_016269 [Polypedilum vanderplanki]|uniref:Uncharacterized protein n=1 Tax=Polypedilum vanderplanki TaxID=319348 RepID=A0A9J6BEY7_POLVA|nr:hypothetical protein PVAND_016269 [Polypedilum vanderplanki]